MDEIKALELILSRYQKGSIYVLKMMFGVTDSVCEVFILFSRCFLASILAILAKDKYAKIEMQSQIECNA